MPVSENQKTLACIALAIKRGETPASYSKEGAEMAKSMSEEKLSEWCKGPVKKE
ncbi:hypothetical protein ES707_01295 [subsurface metagenome]